MHYVRMPIEVESPEEYGYSRIRHNLSESSISDRKLSDFGLTVPDLALQYNDHRGARGLRERIVAGEPGLCADDVLVTAGAAGALFIVATSLLTKDDHLVVVRPNYATNLETPRAIGCAISFVDLSFEDAFRLDLDRLKAALRPNTKVISVTTPHNPTGIALPEEVLVRLTGLAARQGCRLVVDETYRDLRFGELPHLAAALGPHVISVSSLSKAYGIPGIRLGWIVSSDPRLQELFLAAKEQISICGSVIHEWIGEEILARRAQILAATLAEMRDRLTLVTRWVESEPLLEWVPPSGGVVCLPRMRSTPAGGTAGFYRRLLEAEGTYVGPGHWFELPDTCFRLGYGWPTRKELQAGLQGISNALRA
ncbi:MAG TPA: pyridoxal phosphate-dependent aminotransferase [Steroidobacteraceae bacterium]|nr:pyridoxal phosphate-dependent aminotransferase [Steroidobacteraceae bacterium]